MKTKFTISIIIALLLSFSINAQVVVSNSKSSSNLFEKTTKRSPTKVNMKKGQTKNLSFYVFANNVYTFDIEAAQKLGDLNFRIITEDGEIIFDNALAMYNSVATLYAEKTEKITICLTSQPPKIFQANKKFYEVKVKVSYKRNTSA
ncbi:MAG: hypothetical protein JXL97_15540 [Bacteroidales bacterium]|nr:hypothetical protein [Bacteroidales bacterium]